MTGPPEGGADGQRAARLKFCGFLLALQTGPFAVPGASRASKREVGLGSRPAKGLVIPSCVNKKKQKAAQIGPRWPMTEGRRAVMVRVGPKNRRICGEFRPKRPMTERRHAVMGSGVPKIIKMAVDSATRWPMTE